MSRRQGWPASRRWRACANCSDTSPFPKLMKSSGDLEYKPVKLGEDDLKAMALRQRPDVRAAQLGITAAQSQFSLAKSNGKRDVNANINYTHVARLEHRCRSLPASSCRFSTATRAKSPGRDMRSGSLRSFRANSPRIALTDVANSYESLRTNDQVVQLLSVRLSEAGRGFARYQPVRLPARRRQPARFPGRRAQLSRDRACLPASPREYMVALEQLRQAVGTRSLP